MKTHFKKSLFPLGLLAGLGFLLAGRGTAQTFTTLHSFDNNGFYPTNGAHPVAGLILSGNCLYGTALGGGGSVDSGIVFKINTDGTGFTNLHSFGGYPFDGGYPNAGLVRSGNMLFGTAEQGGSVNRGTVFKINADGTDFTNVHSFTAVLTKPPYDFGTNVDGANPFAGLIVSGNYLYGTAASGGNGRNGTVFKINTNDWSFTNLHNFAATNGAGTNSEGANPHAGLVLSGSALFGTAVNGGNSGDGTIFAVSTDGTGFTNLHSFIAPSGRFGTNSDGANPYAGLITNPSGTTLYGTTAKGGSFGWGTVFAINTDGTGFTNLYNFQGGGDGGYPTAGLVLLGNTLYGTATFFGSDDGTVFKVNIDGTGFTNLHSFNYYTDGGSPYAGLITSPSGTTFYGTTRFGVGLDGGTVFSLSFAPQLALISAGGSVILSWPTNVGGFDYTGYTLQCTTNLAAPAVWSTNSPAPVIVNGQLTVTNPITGDQMFYRLSQ